MTTITIQIPFLSWTGKPALYIEIDASIEARFHMRAALQNAVSKGADLGGANLRSADLGGANLRSADLGGADLGGANLRSANLRSANLGGANLRSANLRSANLRSANLGGADLRSANLGGAVNGELAQAVTNIVPSDGAFVGWKKCKNDDIVAVLIPVNAKRSNATGRKCRAEFVEVLGVYDLGSPDPRTDSYTAISTHDGKTQYRKGETVHCDSWCEDRWQECAGGIHFFLTRVEAENY